MKLLETKRVKVKRHADWSGLHFESPSKKPVTEVPAPAAKALSPGAEKVLGNLRKSEKNRPKMKKTLLHHALNFLGKDATTDMSEKVVDELRKSGYLDIDVKGSVSYNL